MLNNFGKAPHKSSPSNLIRIVTFSVCPGTPWNQPIIINLMDFKLGFSVCRPSNIWPPFAAHTVVLSETRSERIRNETPLFCMFKLISSHFIACNQSVSAFQLRTGIQKMQFIQGFLKRLTRFALKDCGENFDNLQCSLKSCKFAKLEQNFTEQTNEWKLRIQTGYSML